MKPEIYAKKIAQARKLQSGQKRIRPVSKRRAGVRQQYKRLAKSFLERARIDGEWAYCPVMKRRSKWIWVTEIHHTRGRIGKLLLEERFWLAVSSEGHRWIHDNPEEARRHGWLCQPGEWNKQP